MGRGEKMRMIKFRAKMIDGSRWVYGGGVWIFKRGTLMLSEDAGGNPIVHNINPETVGQFTGLTDKTGQEIYSGNIVRWHSTHTGADQTEHVDTMTWDDGGACYMLMPWIHEPYAACMEVIGNIHQQDELPEACK
jgi:hypothetical protein